MLFNSWVFAIFFLAVFGLYVLLPHRKQNLLILAASYLFYGWWDSRFTLLLLLSTVVDYNCALAIRSKPERRRLFLFLSLATNLGILGFFKYFNFFVGSAERVFECFGMSADVFTLSIILPVGISFYTFQTLAYTIDVYRGQTEPTRDFVSFAVYVAYFPQLVAGPIERASHLLPLICKPRHLSWDRAYRAVLLIIVGYFKKVFIADGVAPLVDTCFDFPEAFGGVTLALGVFLFALQIYGDFSGYTDIARGVSGLMGIDLRLNFKQPYLSANITEFWRRWHISLSSWLRDYLYVPLGGNRKGVRRTYLNLMLTMLLGGLWHGAGWNFVVWGGLHGVYLAVHKFMLKDRRISLTTAADISSNPASYFVKALSTFILVCFSWVFFRAASIGDAAEFIAGMAARPLGISLPYLVYAVFYGCCVFLVDYSTFRRDAETPFAFDSPRPLVGAACGLMILLLFTIGSPDAQPFIYFQF